MKLSKTQKNLLLKNVHCTKYLRPAKSNYCLEENEKDDKWYYRRDFNTEHGELAQVNYKTWKYNKKYSLIKKEFDGVIVKIDRVPLTSILGVYKVPFFYDLNQYVPAKKNICFIEAATVYYKNGCKRIVPLDCIKESEDFTNGDKTEQLIKNIEILLNEENTKNEITQSADGTITIKNTLRYMNWQKEDFNISQTERSLILNLKQNKALPVTEDLTDGKNFDISDEEYQQVMAILNSQIKEKCGFVPDVSYGQTNYDRLVNFVNFPFAPELNEFTKFFKDSFSKDIVLDSLRKNPSGVKQFIQLCGLTYSSKINKIFLQGHQHFASYLALWYAGFQNEKNIENILKADEKHIIPKAALQFCAVDFDEIYGMSKGEIKIVSIFLTCIKDLFGIYQEKDVERIVLSLFKTNLHIGENALYYLLRLHAEGHLSEDAVKKIGKEGFSFYNHNLLMEIYRTVHPKPDALEDKRDISYTPKEKSLEWQTGEYKFLLPENTTRLVEIGSKMNICVGDLYRDKAVEKKCTIVFVQKNAEYVLCIELNKDSDSFTVVQKSAFNNTPPKGMLLAAFRQWCKVKDIFI